MRYRIVKKNKDLIVFIQFFVAIVNEVSEMFASIIWFLIANAAFDNLFQFNLLKKK